MDGFRLNLAVFFFKQKTAYEITRSLEFRRVLFRSIRARVQLRVGQRFVRESDCDSIRRPRDLRLEQLMYGLVQRVLDRARVETLDRGALGQIGRASCRERV